METPSLAQRVYALVSLIPPGCVMTYKELAHRCGTQAYRAIGAILRANPNIPTVPCHRVVMSDGRLGGYARGVTEKKRLLESEGLMIRGDRIVNFERALFRLV